MRMDSYWKYNISFQFLIWLSSGDWLSCTSERWVCQLFEFSWWVKWLGSVTRVLGFLEEKSSWFRFGRLQGTDGSPGFFIGATQTPGYVGKLNLVWCMVILNCSFRVCIEHPRRLPSKFDYTSKSRCGGRV
jgi:hypothetical protein